MNLRKMPAKKSAKFLILLLTSMLIATVSAQVYRFMYIDGSISVTGAKMIWMVGDDAPDAIIQGSTAVIDLDVETGTPQTFTEALFLKNVEASGSFNYYINVTTVVLSADFQQAQMHINQNSTGSWAYVDTLDLTSLGDNYSGTLNAGNYLRMTFEVNATATTGTYNFDIQVRYWA